MTPDEAAAAYHTHRSRLIGLARRWVRDRGVAEDVVQEVFLAVLAGSGPPPDPVALPRYLSVATINRARSYLRHREVAERHQPERPGAAPSAECTALERLEGAAVAGRLQVLPRMQRRVMALRLDGVPVDEVAALLGVTSGSVKSHASRARARLAKELVA